MNAVIYDAIGLMKAAGKVRSDDQVMRLPEEKIVRIAEDILAALPLRKVSEMCREELGIAGGISEQVLSRFWSRFARWYLIARRRAASELASDVAAEAEREPGKFDAAMIDAIKQKAFELAISPTADPRDVKNVLMLVLKAGDQDIKKSELSLSERKFQRETCDLFLKWQEDQRAREIAAGGGTHSEKIEALGRAMFGDTWEDA